MWGYQFRALNASVSNALRRSKVTPFKLHNENRFVAAFSTSSMSGKSTLGVVGWLPRFYCPGLLPNEQSVVLGLCVVLVSVCPRIFLHVE